MTPPRGPLACLFLLTLVSGAAHAQQWGGSPPATSTMRTTVTTRVTTTGRHAPYRAAFVDPGAYSFVFGAMPAGRSMTSSGGSWNGGGVQWGGAPPSGSVTQLSAGTAAVPGANGPRRPMIAAADSPALDPQASSALPPQPARSRAQQYLIERRRP